MCLLARRTVKSEARNFFSGCAKGNLHAGVTFISPDILTSLNTSDVILLKKKRGREKKEREERMENNDFPLALGIRVELLFSVRLSQWRIQGGGGAKGAIAPPGPQIFVF